MAALNIGTFEEISLEMMTMNAMVLKVLFCIRSIKIEILIN